MEVGASGERHCHNKGLLFKVRIYFLEHRSGGSDPAPELSEDTENFFLFY
jgi:hypothetical protein